MLKATITPLLVLLFMQLYASPLVELDGSYDKQSGSVTLNFQLFKSGIKLYTIEHSADSVGWQALSSEAIDAYENGRPFSYSDQRVASGKNFYRLKYVTDTKEVEYSSTFKMNIPSKNSWLIYPVPVTGSRLTLQYRGIEKNKGVINVLIYSVSGRQAARFRYSSLNTTIQIPVDNLCKGSYSMQVIIENEIVWQQNFVK